MQKLNLINYRNAPCCTYLYSCLNNQISYNLLEIIEYLFTIPTTPSAQVLYATRSISIHPKPLPTNTKKAQLLQLDFISIYGGGGAYRMVCTISLEDYRHVK